MATLNFVASDAPADDFEPVPSGTYTAQIIQSEMKDTKAGTGMYLELRIQILDEDFRGRLIFDRLNLVNPNEQAVKIAQRQLAGICNALGLDEVEDSSELHEQELMVKVTVKEASGDYGASNEIKKYLPVE